MNSDRFIGILKLLFRKNLYSFTLVWYINLVDVEIIDSEVVLGWAWIFKRVLGYSQLKKRLINLIFNT